MHLNTIYINFFSVSDDTPQDENQPGWSVFKCQETGSGSGRKKRNLGKTLMCDKIECQFELNIWYFW